jgi:hypothetical protein
MRVLFIMNFFSGPFSGVFAAPAIPLFSLFEYDFVCADLDRRR